MDVESCTGGPLADGSTKTVSLWKLYPLMPDRIVSEDEYNYWAMMSHQNSVGPARPTTPTNASTCAKRG